MGSNSKVAIAGAPVWLIGWLFTIGFARLNIIEALIGVLIWPYFLGLALR